MIDISNTEEARQLLRELQTLIFDPNIDKKDLFPITLEINKLLDKSIIEINKINKKS
jgi:hypothetical protein